MKRHTKFHGEVEILEDKIIGFDQGIPGFPDEHKFVILPLEENSTFIILQSINTSELAFVMIDPFSYYPEYDFSLEDQVVEALGIDVPEDLLVYCIVTVKDPFEDTTLNLQAPVIVNTKSKKGKQVILNNDKYKIRHKLVEKR